MGAQTYRVLLTLLAAILTCDGVTAGASRTDELFGVKIPGGLQAIYDINLAYGARYRLDDRDPALVATISGGSNDRNSLLDDGNLNYDKHDLTSNMLHATGELTLRLSNLGAFIRGYGFYDYENDHETRARTPLNGSADKQVSSDWGILDAYVSAHFSIGKFPAQIRVGDQVVSWGESGFFGVTGVDVINPLNIPLAQQATATPRDLRKPEGLVWGAVHFSPLVALEAFYQYSWSPTVLPAVGTYLSGGDLIPGVSSAQFTGTASDLGTDVCARFGLNPDQSNFQYSNGTDPDKIKAIEPPPGPMEGGDGCFDFMYLKTPVSKKRIEPDDGGQYGVTLQTLFPRLNDTTFSLHYANYHSRLPYITGISVSQQALDESESNAAFNIRNQLLGPAQAAEYSFANLTKELLLIFEYPEDIQMFGFSANTTTIRTGTAFSAEVAYHKDYPLPVHVGQIVPAIIDRVPPGHPGAEYSPPYQPSSFQRAWLTRDKIQTVLGVTQLFGPRLGASQVAFSLEAAQTHIDNMPDKSKFRLQTPGVALLQYEPEKLFADQNSWGYRCATVFTYDNVFGALKVSPRLVFSHDVEGNSPAGQPFQEGRRVFSIGVNVGYIGRITSDLSYTTFFGAGDYNVLNDRDFLNFNLRYYF